MQATYRTIAELYSNTWRKTEFRYMARLFDEIHSDGFELRYIRNGGLHRNDGPAIEHSGIKVWYMAGVRHRTDGPAVEIGFYKAWYVDGKRHRTDGPAVDCGIDDGNEWWVDGRRLYWKTESK